MSPLLFTMLNIKADTPLDEIQKEFNASFPYLKLEFLYPKEGGIGTGKKNYLDSKRLSKISLKEKPASDISVSEEMTVSSLEKLFFEFFGILAQVFRKSGDSWLETTLTQDWTLKHQNDEGKELSFLKKG